MVAWENKTAAQQTWQNLQDYFTEKWLEQRQCLQATAKQSRFKGSPCSPRAGSSRGRRQYHRNDVCPPPRATKAQLKAMAASNKQAMDAMLERMNALIAGQGKVADKVTATIPNSNLGQATKTATNRKKVCKKLQKAHSPQTANLLRAQSQCKQALPRMEIEQSCQCNGLTGTGDVK
jgi:hypothetical protein